MPIDQNVHILQRDHTFGEPCRRIWLDSMHTTLYLVVVHQGMEFPWLSKTALDPNPGLMTPVVAEYSRETGVTGRIGSFPTTQAS